MWKKDNHNGINVTTENAKDLMDGKMIVKQKKKVSGENIRLKYKMVDTGKYINLEEVKEQ